MDKIIIILLDGLNPAAGCKFMPFLYSLTKQGIAAAGIIDSVLPPISRPAYASLLTGLAPYEHGFFLNDQDAVEGLITIFSRASEHGYCTAAAAYSWIYELCFGKRFSLIRDRFVVSPEGPINFGLFYASDSYPDPEAFADGNMLITHYKPYLILVHSMGIDNAGHNHGGNSPSYLDAVRQADQLCARYLPHWLTDGYSILILADHGMGNDGSHYSLGEECQMAPIWGIGDFWSPLPQSLQEVGQRILAAL